MSDQFQYIKLPDGSYGKFRADASDDQIRTVLMKNFPEAMRPGIPSSGTGAPPNARANMQQVDVLGKPQDSGAATAGVPGGAPNVQPASTAARYGAGAAIGAAGVGVLGPEIIPPVLKMASRHPVASMLAIDAARSIPGVGQHIPRILSYAPFLFGEGGAPAAEVEAERTAKPGDIEGMQNWWKSRGGTIAAERPNGPIHGPGPAPIQTPEAVSPPIGGPAEAPIIPKIMQEPPAPRAPRYPTGKTMRAGLDRVNSITAETPIERSIPQNLNSRMAGHLSEAEGEIAGQPPADLASTRPAPAGTTIPQTSEEMQGALRKSLDALGGKQNKFSSNKVISNGTTYEYRGGQFFKNGNALESGPDIADAVDALEAPPGKVIEGQISAGKKGNASQ
jgi:hypothetical protein